MRSINVERVHVPFSHGQHRFCALLFAVQYTCERGRDIFNAYTDTLSHYNSPTLQQRAAALVAVTISAAAKANSSSSSASSSSCSCSHPPRSRIFIFALWITFLPYISRPLFFSPRKHPLVFVTIVLFPRVEIYIPIPRSKRERPSSVICL